MLSRDFPSRGIEDVHSGWCDRRENGTQPPSLRRRASRWCGRGWQLSKFGALVDNLQRRKAVVLGGLGDTQTMAEAPATLQGMNVNPSAIGPTCPRKSTSWLGLPPRAGLGPAALPTCGPYVVPGRGLVEKVHSTQVSYV